MVILGKAREREDIDRERTAMRSKPPLHNFDMPPSSLRWGGQRFLRCMKANPSASSAGRRNHTVGDAGKIYRSIRGFHSPEIGRRTDSGDDDGGIEAVREKLMLDLQTETDKIRFAILRGGGLAEEREDESPPPPPATVAQQRPMNLRKRRAVTGGGCRKPNSSPPPPKTECNSSRFTSAGTGTGEAVTGGEAPEKAERSEFSVSLSREEIAEDFMAMVGHKPPRRPKKRPKVVQKQLDCLFPGLWLTEITPELYRVDDDPETGKR